MLFHPSPLNDFTGSNSSEDDDACEKVTIQKEAAWTLNILHQAFNLLDELAEVFQNGEQWPKAALQNPVLLLHPSHNIYYPMCLNCAYFWNPSIHPSL